MDTLKKAVKRATKILHIEEKNRAKFIRERQRLIPDRGDLDDEQAWLAMAVIRSRKLLGIENSTEETTKEKQEQQKKLSKIASANTTGTLDNSIPTTSCVAKQQNFTEKTIHEKKKILVKMQHRSLFHL